MFSDKGQQGRAIWNEGSGGPRSHTGGLDRKEGAALTLGGPALQEVRLSHAKAHGQDGARLGEQQGTWAACTERAKGRREEGRAEGTGQVTLTLGGQAERHREPQGAGWAW